MARSIGKPALVQIGVRIPKDMKAELEERAQKQELTVTDVIIRAIRKGLAV